jgi:hypothetical protein
MRSLTCKFFHSKFQPLKRDVKTNFLNSHVSYGQKKPSSKGKN